MDEGKRGRDTNDSPVSEESGRDSKRSRGNQDNDGGSSTSGWSTSGNSTLFGEAKRSSVQQPSDKRLERALSQITVEMIDDVRLSVNRIKQILEHPRAAEYLVGAYVRYPVIEGQDVVGVSCLPSQIVRVVVNEQQANKKELLLVQYTQSDSRSLKILKETCNMDQVSSHSFTTNEVNKWKGLLRLFSGRPGVEKLYTLPKSMEIKQSQLAEFTFTDSDVRIILESKSKDTSSGGTSNLRSLYSRKSELELSIKALRGSIQSGTLSATEHSESLKNLRQQEDSLKETLASLANMKAASAAQKGLTNTSSVTQRPTTVVVGTRFLESTSSASSSGLLGSGSGGGSKTRTGDDISASLTPLSELLKPRFPTTTTTATTSSPPKSTTTVTSSSNILQLPYKDWTEMLKYEEDEDPHPQSILRTTAEHQYDVMQTSSTYHYLSPNQSTLNAPTSGAAAESPLPISELVKLCSSQS